MRKITVFCIVQIIGILLVIGMVMASRSFAADVTIAVTKSLDDPTPRSSVFPSSLSPVFLRYDVEQNGALLSQTCAAGCTSVTITGIADGTYSFRLGAVVRVTRSDGSQAETVGWSPVKSVTINCGTVALPDAPEWGNATQVCK